jgi:hypothetical protein
MSVLACLQICHSSRVRLRAVSATTSAEARPLLPQRRDIVYQ